MIIYFIVFFAVIVFSSLSAGVKPMFSKKISCLCAAIVMVVLGGLRWGIWTDWPMYNNLYLHPFNVTHDFEIGYVFINQIFNVLDIDYTIYLIVYYVVILTVMITLAKSYSNKSYAFSLLVYASLFYLVSGGMRQHIALFFFLWSLEFILSKDLVKFLFVILLGSLFHRTLLVMIPVFWVSKFNLSPTVLIVSILLAITLVKLNVVDNAISFFVNKITGGGPFARRIKFYYLEMGNRSNIGLGFFRKVVVLFLCYCSCYSFKYDKLRFFFRGECNEGYKLFVNLYLMGIVIGLLLFGVLGRLATYLYFVECLLIPLFFQSLRKRVHLLGLVLIIAIYSLGFVQSLRIFDHSSTGVGNEFYIPYKSCL